MNNQLDPIHRLEEMVRKLQEKAGGVTQPVFSRYPIVFAFLVIFSAAAIIHGFEIWASQIELFEKHPVALILSGLACLILTGTLYKALDKMS